MKIELIAYKGDKKFFHKGFVSDDKETILRKIESLGKTLIRFIEYKDKL